MSYLDLLLETEYPPAVIDVESSEITPVKQSQSEGGPKERGKIGKKIDAGKNYVKKNGKAMGVGAAGAAAAIGGTAAIVHGIKKLKAKKKAKGLNGGEKEALNEFYDYLYDNYYLFDESAIYNLDEEDFAVLETIDDLIDYYY